MKALGICCGASTITTVEVERQRGATQVVRVSSKVHEGNPKQVVTDLLTGKALVACDRARGPRAARADACRVCMKDPDPRACATWPVGDVIIPPQ